MGLILLADGSTRQLTQEELDAATAAAAPFVAADAKNAANATRLDTIAKQAAKWINNPASFATLQSGLGKIMTTAGLTVAEKTAFTALLQTLAEGVGRLVLASKSEEQV